MTNNINKKKELLKARLAKKTEESKMYLAVENYALNKKQHLKTSFSQQRLFFMDRLQGSSVEYNMPSAFEIEGDFSSAIAEQALSSIISRHEILHSVYVENEQGEALQRIQESIKFEITRYDLTSEPDNEKQAKLELLIKLDAKKSFDLTLDLMMRASYIVLERKENDGIDKGVLLFNMHHIASDGWSLDILVREFVALYQAIKEQRPANLSPLDIQYADYAHWQREYLKGELLESQLSYWDEQLSDTPPVHSLVLDNARPAVKQHTGERLSSQLPSEVAVSLLALSKKHQLTPFMLLHGALALVLSRHSNNTDIVIGTPVANRFQSELEPLIGFFVNTLVLRLDTSYAQLSDYFSHIRQVHLDAQSNQDVPFEQLVERLKVARSTAYTPLFQIMLTTNTDYSLGNTTLDNTLKIADASLSPLKTNMITAKFDLDIAINISEHGIRLNWTYDTSIFSEEKICMLDDHLCRLLNGLAASKAVVTPADIAISELPILSPKELNFLIHSQNDTYCEYPENKLIHQLFEEQVIKTPDNVAIVFEGSKVTYSELNEKANQVAHYLLEHGVKPNTLVGICIERSINMVISMLGVLKSGAGYLPIEPNSPKGRVTSILQQLGESHQENLIFIASRSQLKWIREVQWTYRLIKHVLLIDSKSTKLSYEHFDFSAVETLFDYIVDTAEGAVDAAGFKSIYTGKVFSEVEVDFYRNWIVSLASQYINSDSCALEIGCGSGLISYELGKQVSKYYALDPSPITQQKNQEYVYRSSNAKNYKNNIEFITGFAHQLPNIKKGSLDLVLIASTVQFFPDAEYLKETLDDAIELLKPGGVIVLADILDLKQQQELNFSIERFQENNPEYSKKDYSHSVDKMLYLHEGFFSNYQKSSMFVDEIEVKYRNNGGSSYFDNELKYRFDVIIKKSALTKNRLKNINQEGGTVFNFSTLWELTHYSKINPNIRLSSDSLAYTIFTSGTTGIPKGVVLQHKAVVNTLDWVNRTFGVCQTDYLLCVSSISFDLSVYDIFGLLAVGGKIKVASSTECSTPSLLADILLDDSITFWNSSPAYMDQIIPYLSDCASIEASKSLKLVFFSGDWIGLHLPVKVKNIFNNAKIIGLGGATEAAIWSNYFLIEDVDPTWKSIPYGKPIQNSQYYVLDKRLQPCPIGVPGDLFIAGDCLALGYLNDEKTTSSKFVKNNLNSNKSQRLYLTGDQARWMHDGNLEFLGRVDNQVKVRGFRIELGEIEYRLKCYDEINDALVVAVHDVISKGLNQKRLVAYVLPRDIDIVSVNAKPFIEKIKRYLAKNIPNYMMPFKFILINEVPLSSNGKVDRKALPELNDKDLQSVEYVAPSNPTETTLCKIWEDLLGIKNIGIEDDFFELGGHSLLATRLISSIRKNFEIELPLKILFDYPTIKMLSIALTQDFKGQLLPAIQTLNKMDCYQLSSSQQRLWTIDKLQSGSPEYNIPMSFA
ncbi:MAG: amino acid adenylation domain-containing protein, partial [Francisellaceae bacterium]